MPTTAPKTPITTRITRLAPTSALVAAWRALLAAAVHRGGGVLVHVPKTKPPLRRRAVRVVEVEPPPAAVGIPAPQPLEPFSELIWRSCGPDGRMVSCCVLAAKKDDAFEVWLTSNRGTLVAPIRRTRSLRVARRVAHGLEIQFGAAARRAASPAARRPDAGQIDDTTRPPVRADVEIDRVRP